MYRRPPGAPWLRRQSPGSQEGIRPGEFQCSSIDGQRAARRSADYSRIGKVAGEGQRGIILNVDAVAQLRHRGAVHRHRAAVYLELAVQIDAARQRDIARSLRGKRRAAQIAAQGEISGGEYLVARKHNIVGKGSPRRAVPFRADVGIRQLQHGIRPHGHIVELEVAAVTARVPWNSVLIFSTFRP